MPASSRDWMRHEAAESIGAIEAAGCPVYGDLADLLPRSECFGSDDSGLAAICTEDVLTAALDSLRAAVAAKSVGRVRS